MRAVAVALLVAAAAPVAAQQPPADSAARLARLRFWARPVASLVVPGSGQLLAGQDRGAVYLAVELYTLSRFIQLQRNAADLGSQFRLLALDVARRGYASDARDTVWEYYEQMERWASSGQFNRGSNSNFVPEDDPATYNGQMWLLARRTFWPNPDSAPPPTSPEYQRALAFYTARAIGPDFLWSWNGSTPELEAYRQEIRASDDAYRRAQNQLGALLANHLLSAVDALISVRLSAVTRHQTTLRTAVAPLPAWSVTIAF